MATSSRDKALQPVIIKRVKKKGGHAAHGGAWKIAYADFMTAMMAFFLLMWLLGSTSEGDKKGIAEYFQNPLRVSMSGGSGAGDATAVIAGGGTDLTRSAGQVSKGEGDQTKKLDTAEAEERIRKAERAQLEALKERIQTLINASEKLRAFKSNIKIDITSEGLRIQIVDDQARPMFDVSSSTMKPYARDILRELGPALNGVENPVSIAGHTDSLAFAGGQAGFSNWELSSERANAARRELVFSGMLPEKVLQVRGLADALHLDPSNPLNPENRRISITVLNKQAVQALRAFDLGDSLTEPAPEPAPAAEPSPPAPPAANLSPLERLQQAAREAGAAPTRP